MEEDIKVLKKCWVMTTDHVLDDENKKLKNAIEHLLEEYQEQSEENYKMSEWLVEKQKKIEELEKMVDLMSWTMTHEDVPQDEYCVSRDINCEVVGGNRDCEDCIKEYFQKKVREKERKS